MALQAILTSMDGISEEMKKEYRQPTEAEIKDNPELKDKFVLDVTGVSGYRLENVDGLKSALGAERTRAQTAEDKLKNFGDLDPKAARDALAKVDEFAKFDPKSEADRMAAEKFEAAKAQMAAKHAEEMGAKDKETQDLRGTVERLLVDTAVTDAIDSNKGRKKLLFDAVKKQVRLKKNDDGSYATEVIDAKGNPMVGGSRGEPMTIAQYVSSLKEDPDYKVAFEGDGKGGSGSESQRSYTPGEKTVSRDAVDSVSLDDLASGKVTVAS